MPYTETRTRDPRDGGHHDPFADSSRALCSALALVALAAARRRAPTSQPGDVINKANADKVKDLVSPGVMWCIEHGMTMKIVPYKKIEWNPPYKEATEKYSGQVKLAADGRSIEGHVAGLPFPNIDPNDPQVALKIMWNYEYKPFVTDDQDLRNFDADTGTVVGRARSTSSATTSSITCARSSTPARLYVDPKPVLLPNTDGVRAKQSLHPILEPFDLKGVGLTGIRYLDPDRQDDTWLYLPTLRRVRRLSSAQRSDALFGQDTDVDSYGGYAGQIPWFTWKFLGEQEDPRHLPRREVPGRVLPGRRRLRLLRQLGDARRVGASRAPPSRRSTPTASACSSSTRRRTTSPTATSTTRPASCGRCGSTSSASATRRRRATATPTTREMPFTHSITMVDMQLSHATRAALPSSKYPGEAGWYFNQGAKTGLTEEFFTIAHMIGDVELSSDGC